MQKEIIIPRNRSPLERTADIAAGYILIAAIAALGLFAITATLSLASMERGYAIAARV